MGPVFPMLGMLQPIQESLGLSSQPLFRIDTHGDLNGSQPQALSRASFLSASCSTSTHRWMGSILGWVQQRNWFKYSKSQRQGLNAFWTSTSVLETSQGWEQ